MGSVAEMGLIPSLLYQFFFPKISYNTYLNITLVGFILSSLKTKFFLPSDWNVIYFSRKSCFHFSDHLAVWVLEVFLLRYFFILQAVFKSFQIHRGEEELIEKSELQRRGDKLGKNLIFWKLGEIYVTLRQVRKIVNSSSKSVQSQGIFVV